MTFSHPSPMVAPEADRHARLRGTATFRDGGFARWVRAQIAVFGAGALGGPLATGIVRSGARVGVVDFDIRAPENRGTQLAEPGVSKVKTVVAACDGIDAGRARGFECDVRHVGVGVLDQFNVFIDCTDDPNLALPLTEISNGLGKPLLRCALDGSGATEMGRVLCSSGATAHACQICSFGLDDLRSGRRRSGCPDPATHPRRATIAGGAMAMAIAGLGLLSAQRLVTGNDDELVLGHETLLDFTNLQLLPMALARSERCLTGHLRWELSRFDATASRTTLDEVFSAASDEFSTADVVLEPYLHPLNSQAQCECGQEAVAVGTNWATAPRCSKCQQPMSWRRVLHHDRITRQLASDLGILDTSLTKLGLPESGAMIIARSAARPPVRYVFDVEPLTQPL